MLPDISGGAALAGSTEASIMQKPTFTHPSKTPQQIFMTLK
jgi:hypothetical protein